uniref:acetyl-CoA C-acyltransferase n=1 Tax=Chromera velia CCMP2878 TaxID=1169474 RepID=A0A0G4H6Y4_9ALVE|mmetsp:Transcript_18571/g.37576  ORF Transcript_18571/g.37576 Transcript_18571/m.37576 type:complete len:412 (-) Transcript_18571:814-2049(-)|eukprot:Cvel_5796.t1-p1 / transcript=Cvel_5796.t1 / gene=Cvel_5796 / organism=Chromera_velia_CCMP2878 / gene_product=3-ketoacyl-CoA thiolase, peroxisomal, putative / transcript_product=3-ketoacyl-CoA thiolase, peroxisomal, putative / location=Cvel_scaffold275:81873-83883(+) / protein_length=411 / sequence_SO=supercontig / SO=protein_coding / is_pseudo=false
MQRISNISGHVKTAKSPSDDVVICCAVRTAVCKAKKGSFKDTMPEDMLAPLFEALVKRTGVNPKDVGDVCIGNVLQPGGGALSSRIGQLLSGWPADVPVMTVNRQCSSGLQACANIAAQIEAGYIDVGVGGGVESMTNNDMQATLNPEQISENVFEHEGARNCLLPMGITSENVAAKYGISRDAQDTMAVESHAKAAKAQQAGLFREEIVPVRAKIRTTAADGSEDVVEKVVDADEGIRAATTMASLQKLKPAFQKGGTTTAGNSSQVSDGAALVLMARRSAAERLRLPIIGRFVSFSAVGVPPEVMGIGPAVAIPAALRMAGLTIKDIDVFEVNEAFASQATYCMQDLGIPKQKLNPKGGAIALGHPLGCTGARQIATLMPELKRTGGKYGVVSMCIGTGMGAAAVIERL